MKYINLKSNRGLVNKMADFILTKLTLEYDSVIEVTDCGKFFVINGMTNSKEVQELSENTDLNIWSITQTDTLNIELDYSETETSNLTNFTYSPLTTTSEFPYGHSLNMGRLHYYYSEYISNHIFTIIDAKKIDFKISTKLNNDEDFDIELISDSKLYSKDVIKSLVLDVFDFNLDNFKFILSNYDIREDLELPFGPKPWLVKDRIEDLIVF